MKWDLRPHRAGMLAAGSAAPVSTPWQLHFAGQLLLPGDASRCRASQGGDISQRVAIDKTPRAWPPMIDHLTPVGQGHPGWLNAGNTTALEQHRLSAGHDPFTVEHPPCPYRDQPPPRSHACRTTIRARPSSNCARRRS
jgi:hypothetical protein